MLSTSSQLNHKYQPLARIGRGGMAEVFLALTRGSEVTKVVVLKRIWDELAADPEFVDMFLDEARLSARMSHPNVVQTYEVMEAEGRLTMAMEYLDGQPLTRVLNRLSRAGDLTLAHRLRIIIDILAGLDHAHELKDYDGTPLGVVHRDVSPHNVFITYDGHVKLVDFGVAKTLASAHQTRPGAIKGKLAYMAPEQLRGPLIDRRADIFSVGVMLWELLAGRRLFQGMTEVTIVHHLSFGLPVPQLDGELALPDGLEEICLRALSPHPADRFSTAAEMEDALRRVLPSVTDSHPRHLGKIISIAFASERAERQLLIDRHLTGLNPPVSLDGYLDEPPSADTAASLSLALVPLPSPDAEGVPRPRRAFGGRGLSVTALVLASSLLLAFVVSSAHRVEESEGTGLHHSPPPISSAQGLTTRHHPVIMPVDGALPGPGESLGSATGTATAVEATRAMQAGGGSFTGPLTLDEAPYRAQARRHRRAAIADGAWSDRTRDRPHHASRVRGLDPFALEVGPSPQLARRREIDTESPFTTAGDQ